MDIKAYIESGILEQHVLGIASPQDSAEVVRYAAKYPEIQAEIDKIEDTLFQFGQAQSIQPPADLKAKIMAQLDAKVYDLPTEKNIQSKDGSTGMSRWELMGLILAMLFAVGTYYFYNSNNNLISEKEELQTEYAALQSRHTALQEECAKVRNEESVLIKQMAIVKDLDTKPVLLKGTKNSPESKAIVYWNGDKKSTLLDVSSLPTPSKDKQYQLWAIVDGNPVDLGVFNLGVDMVELHEVPFVKNPQAFAVTLEPFGGVKSPTTDQMYVVGNI